MKTSIMLGTILCAAMSVAAIAQQSARPPTAPRPANMGMGSAGTIQKVADNIYVIPGGGGNTTVFVASKGVVLVDS